MENSNTFKQTLSQKIPLTAQERKAKSRAKAKALREGIYEPQLIEEAKTYLNEIQNFDIEELYKNEKFKKGLSDNDIKQLKTFIQNKKQKIKQQILEQKNKSIQKLNIQEKASRLGNQQIPILHQSLLTPQTYEERKQLIKQKINENLFLFLEYMENYSVPTQDFLEIILDLYETFDIETSTKLFVRVCSMNRGEILQINEQMVQNALQFLIESKHDNIAAFGLLRLVFQNKISFINYPIQLLQDFQQEYEQTILNFYKSIPQLPFQVYESLPSTCFCFTKPLLNSLSNGGEVLHQQIPYQFLPYIIEILSYSFNDDEEQFLIFLQSFKNGCRKLYEILLRSEFSHLLQNISDQTKRMTPLFFKQLKHIRIVIERSFELLIEKKIDIFNDNSIAVLMDLNQDKYQIMKMRPKILKESSQIQNKQILENIKENNKEIDILYLDDFDKWEQQCKSIFQSMGIQTLLPIQQYCYQFCIKDSMKGLNFLQYDTGQGKTSLCLGIAISFVRKNYKVMILNKCEGLCFRDFKKALQIQNELDIRIQYFKENMLHDKFENSIIYITWQCFAQEIKNIMNLNLENLILIIDECDLIFFEEEFIDEFILECFQKIKLTLAFTGSNLQEVHRDFLKIKFNAKFLNFSLNQQNMIKPVCTSSKVVTSYIDLKNHIIQQCLRQVFLTPIIIIMNAQGLKMKNFLQNKKIPVELLIGASPQYLESSLLQFNKKQDDKYSVYIIDQEQGRGFDFITNSEIEANGGVYLIITCLPKHYLSFSQFLGRTGRIGNKGQYEILMYDKQAKNCSGEIYLNKKLTELYNKDIIYLSSGQEQQNKNLQDNISQNTLKNQNLQEDNEDEEQQNNKINNIQNIEIIDNELSQTISQINNLENNHQLKQQFELDKVNEEEKEIKNQSNINRKRIQKKEQKFENQLQIIQRTQINQQHEVDKLYFQSYENPQIHTEMLQDQVRMEAYQNAINQVCAHKVIVDVGAGTGVLSMLAAKANAKHVYAIEYCNIAKEAQKIINDNGYQNVISLLNVKAEEAILPHNTIDILISEWMGYFLLFENMLPSVIHIRDKYLKEEGMIIPSRSSIHLAAFTKNPEIKGLNIIQLWKNQTEEARIEIIKQEQIISNSAIIYDIDLRNESPSQNKFDSQFELVIQNSGILSGFVGWFVSVLTENISLSTAPDQPETHWKQTLFYLKKPIEVKEGTKLRMNINVRPHKDNYRGLQIKISYGFIDIKSMNTQYYYLS